MSNQIVPASSTSALTLCGGSKTVRLSKKEFFATLPSELGRSEKERRFAAYAEQFSAAEAAGISGALASGLVRITRTAVNQSGKGGTIRFEVVAKTGRVSKTAQLEAEVAALRAELAAAKQPAPAATETPAATA